MTKKYNPTEDQISRVLKQSGGEPRALAIAYLRAQERCRQSEKAFEVMNGLAEANHKLHRDDADGAIDALDDILRKLNTTS